MTGVDLTFLSGGDSDAPLLGVLALLALLDSTSFGTLLIPLWLTLAPGRLRGGRILAYLAVVGGAYAAIGIALLGALTFVGDGVVQWLEGARQSSPFLLAQLAAGAGLLAYSFRIDPMTEAGKAAKRQREERRGTAGRMNRFRERAVGSGAGGFGALMGLAVVAVGLELPTLLPYLAGIGLVAGTGPAWPGSSALILFYCAVMLVPACLVLTGRLVAHRLVDAPLRRLEVWLSRHAGATIGWVVGILGLLLGLNALGGLGLT
ncbi:GAP family protein [Zhihengliuella halotolerans]|uniref:Sap-like sulfolipid-1-addressing protein n=1 Tax=Zhihengliuella halotolerans TaxID=370736 RepID=A0A4Q8AI34_9MICC|nr:GAP family protein [Zhihengliuella halotolerans]RZU63379.1 Sap-like sulfolipid-1-addressing protein [Zhihengliuella halotolerans]